MPKNRNSGPHRPDSLVRRDIVKLIAEGDERCLLCRKPFDHNVSMYAGVADNGAIAVVGDCCVDRMKWIYATGLTQYANRIRSDA
jgi:hypothetical protein